MSYICLKCKKEVKQTYNGECEKCYFKKNYARENSSTKI